MIRLSPIEMLKVTLIGLALIYGVYIWESRKDALALVQNLQAQLKVQADLATAVDARQSAARADAERKAKNEADHLRGRIAWLQKQTPKGCDDAARIIHEYRVRQP